MSPAWMPCSASWSGEQSLRHAEAPARGHHQHLAIDAQLARHDPHRVDVAAVRRDDHHLAQPGARHAFADLGPHALRGLGRVGDGAGRADVLVRLADRLHGQEQRRQILRQLGDHGVDHALTDDRVGRYRKMRPMLLDRRDRQHRDRLLGIETCEVFGRELQPVNLAHGQNLSIAARTLAMKALRCLIRRDVHVIERVVVDLRARRKARHVARHDLLRRIADQQRIPPRPAVGRDPHDALEIAEHRDRHVWVRQVERDAGHQQPVHPAFEHRGRAERPDRKLADQRVGLAQAAHVVRDARLVLRQVVILAPLRLAHHRIEFLRVEVAEIDRVPGLLQAGERFVARIAAWKDFSGRGWQ